MKITKSQLRRIIREEKARLTEQAAAGAYNDVKDTMLQLLDTELTRLGHDRVGNPEIAEDVASALEDIASEVRRQADAPARGWEEPRR